MKTVALDLDDASILDGNLVLPIVQQNTQHSKSSTPKDVNKGIAKIDLILRLVAIVGTLGGAVAMGTTNATLPFFARFIPFKAGHNDLPTFTFFVAANGIVSAYLVLSLALSIFHMLKSGATLTRVILISFDTVTP
ncbi:unnamed protein product [Ilex paraguariensis]|uniref:CASP-like protein n=1 Tax=Ilex paraguariensis TaxID=185542 RepID=A0ABC8UYA7_9AQUA